MRRSRSVRAAVLAAAPVLLIAAASHAAITMAPLSSFGGGDGWLAPGEGGYTYLGTSNNERGLAVGNGHLYLSSRTGGLNVRILDPNSGADLGGFNTTGITGGTFALSMIAAGGDGVLYGANLTTNATSSPFIVYKWTSEAAAPAVAYSGAPLAGARIGDDLAAVGSGSSTRLAAGFGSSPTVAGNNGYAILDPTASSATAVGFSGTPAPTAGNFRLGLTFGQDSSHVLGSAGSSSYAYTSYSGSAGTLLANVTFPDPNGNTADRLLAFTVLDGIPILAVQSTGDSHVTIYDATDPANPVYLATGNNTTGTLSGNANGTGNLVFDKIDNFNANLYAMSTNQGIQAFTISIPEPTSLGLLAMAAIPLLRRRRA